MHKSLQRIVERRTPMSFFIPPVPVESSPTREELLSALTCVVLNAAMQPDASMGGLTDCYAVPFDDIEAARAIVAKANGERA